MSCYYAIMNPSLVPMCLVISILDEKVILVLVYINKLYYYYYFYCYNLLEKSCK